MKAAPTPHEVLLDRVLAAVRTSFLEAIADYDKDLKKAIFKASREARSRARLDRHGKPYGHPEYPKEAFGLELIVRMRKEKRTIRDIVAALDDAGHRARRGRWNPGSVLRIVKREGLK